MSNIRLSASCATSRPYCFPEANPFFDGQSRELKRLTSDAQFPVSFGHKIGAAKGVLISIAASLLFWSVILLVSLA
jgi:hypothetical protein